MSTEPKPHPDSSGDPENELSDAASEQVSGARGSDDPVMPSLATEDFQIRTSAFQDALDAQAHDKPLTESIPGYQILREIHRGGQGVVYQAIQKSTKRRVAIKVMREGPFAGRHDQIRFEREVQVLGALNHPSIVSIHDSGTAAGSFYYVMDYISGQPLDVWMASQQRSVDETLRMFARICEAVNAAHLRGVIHRDLKPGNIRIDAEDNPHILDFGLAKMATGQVTDDSRPQLMTITGQFVGSLPWASPEQAEAIPSKIDTRTDVYALGVILYQMLTGQFPYQVAGNMRDVLDNIIRAEPARPSTIRKQVNDEVETIVLKCLSKERERRYQTAGELARDVGHYLAGEPIEAKRDSALYLVRKSLRRYRIPVAIAAGFVVLLAAGLTVTSVLYYQAEKAKRAEATARTWADAKTLFAEQERKRAEVERDKATTARQLQEQQLYAAAIQGAAHALVAGDTVATAKWLERAPPALRQWEWSYLARISTTSYRVLAAHAGAITQVVYSRDARLVASASDDNTARIWRTSDWTCAFTLDGHKDAVLCVALSNNGLYAATGSDDATVRVWDLTTGRCAATYDTGNAGVTSICFDPTDTVLAAASRDGSIGIWDLAASSLRRRIQGDKGQVIGLAFSRDHDTLYWGTENDDKTISVWNVHSDEARAHYSVKGYVLTSLLMSPDSDCMLTGDRDSSVCFRDALTGAERARIMVDTPVEALAVTTDWTQLAIGCVSGAIEIRRWDPSSEETPQKLFGHRDRITSLAFSPNHEFLVSGSRDQTVRVWRPNSPETGETVLAHPGLVAELSFGPDSKTLAVAGQGDLTRIWDVASSAAVADLRLRGGFSSTVFMPDGEHVLAGSAHSVALWSVKTQEILKSWELPESRGAVQSLAVSPDGTTAAVCTRGEYMRVWELETDRVVQEHYAWHCAYSPDGTRMATATWRGKVNIWNTQTGKLTFSFDAHEGEGIAGLSWSHDGTRLATASYDQTACVWEVGTGRRLATMKGHTHWVTDVCFSPDGKRIATCAFSGHVKVWDTDTGWELVTLLGLTNAIALSFSPDGRKIAAGGWGKTVKIWDSSARCTMSSPSTLTGTTTKKAAEAAGEGILDLVEAKHHTIVSLGPPWVYTKGWVTTTRRVENPETKECYRQALAKLEKLASQEAGSALTKLSWHMRFFVWDKRRTVEEEENWRAVIAGAPIFETSNLCLCFEWGAESPHSDVPADYFAAVAATSLEIKDAGRYRVCAVADDGVRVWVDDQLVIDKWGPQPPSLFTKEIELSRALHSVRVEYFEETLGAILAVWIEPISLSAAPG